ncbi:C39 family peptidase [Xylanivirga thermophila]|uniref:C39 family peptidase n=1 Tax=Xylanivirga thermophila TaxID=2496273 RepID=UPI001FB256DA|nr:C39 family peptidase [Xylanivirga thermophila]
MFSSKDKEERKTMLIILSSTFVVKFLIFTAIVYILTSPFKLIADFFSDDEIAYAEDFYNQYSLDQCIEEESEDYIYSSELDFSSYDFEDSSIDVVYYNQADSRWKDKPYGKTGTIGRSGCGPTSLAMVISTLGNKIVNPVEMARWSYKNGYYAEGAGSMHKLIPAGAISYGLNVEGVGTNAEKIIHALSNKKLVIAIMGKGHFTKAGHFIVLRGITEEGKILVADPISIKRSEQEWDLELILREAKKGADARGPFWVVWR